MRRRTNARRTRTLLIGTAITVMAVGVVGCASDDDDALAAATAPTTTPADAETDDTPSRTITVTGEGSVSVKPDIAYVQMGVWVSGDTAQEVLDLANEKTTALLAALEALGVAEDDLRTTGLGLYPTYDADGKKIDGFEAYNDLEVTIRDLARAGEIIDGGAAFAGEAITIGGISLAVDDPESVLDAARAEAVANAGKRAAEYAAAAEVGVGEVLVISETGVSTPAPYFGEAAADAATGVPIAPGTTELTVTVTVVFELV